MLCCCLLRCAPCLLPVLTPTLHLPLYRPSASAAATGGRSDTTSQQDKKGQQQQQHQPNLNAAVGAAVSGAGKVAGAVGSIAVEGARQLLTGLIPRPPGTRVRQGCGTWPLVCDAAMIGQLCCQLRPEPGGRLVTISVHAIGMDYSSVLSHLGVINQCAGHCFGHCSLHLSLSLRPAP